MFCVNRNCTSNLHNKKCFGSGSLFSRVRIVAISGSITRPKIVITSEKKNFFFFFSSRSDSKCHRLSLTGGHFLFPLCGGCKRFYCGSFPSNTVPPQPFPRWDFLSGGGVMMATLVYVLVCTMHVAGSNSTVPYLFKKKSVIELLKIPFLG